MPGTVSDRRPGWLVRIPLAPCSLPPPRPVARLGSEASAEFLQRDEGIPIRAIQL